MPRASAELMPAATPTANQIAQRLIDRKRSAAGADATQSSAAALAVGELYQGLSRWIGSEGCHALMARARAEAAVDHPLLSTVQLRARTQPYVDGLPETVAEYGEAATADSIRAMLVGMIDLLGRLIGVDMATNLIERTLPEPASESAGTEKRSAKG